MFFVGILLFSSSLHVTGTQEIGWVSLVAMPEGLAFILGWLLLAVAALKQL